MAPRSYSDRHLAEAGTDALPVLEAILGMPIAEAQEAACDVVKAIGKPAVPMLRELTGHLNPLTRFYAVRALRALAPEATSSVPELARALRDPSDAVAREAATVLAALGNDASSAVPQLEVALRHPRREIRTASAGALAAIGSNAAGASRTLARSLNDSHPSVRRSAAMALAAIGPAIESADENAVPNLTRCLGDENVHVRVSTVEALGSIGPKAQGALEDLRAVADDPALRAQVAWAIARIEGRDDRSRATADSGSKLRRTATTVDYVTRDSWRMFCGGPLRNAVVRGTNLPLEWDTETGKNIRWSSALGEISYGTPMISNGRVYVGTDNERPRDPSVTGKHGVLLALAERNGELLWQDVAQSRNRGLDKFLLPTTSSAPLLDEGRLYYLTAQGVVRCMIPRDVAPELVWELDLGSELGVFPHEAPNCAILPFGEALLLCTSNGVDEAHVNIPAPQAPSFLALDKRDGRVLWSVVGPSPRVLHGQWSSPALLEAAGKTLALFGGGDGCLYALDATTGQEIWRFDGNPKDAVWRVGSDVDDHASRNNIIACPVVAEGRIYLTMGQDPNHGHGRGAVFALDPNLAPNRKEPRVIWKNEEVGRATATPIIDAGFLYVADLNAIVWCLDSADGRTVWKHDLFAPVWSCLLLADNRLYVGDEDGTVTVFAAGRRKRILAQNSLDSPIWAGASVANETLFIATTERVWAIGKTSD
ncbi:MAG: PQQ-binding-like beta-propeller repeat protein [Planctomycetota bacterium]